MWNQACALLVANICSLACILIAAFLAYHNKDGWGWFLFVAVLAGHSLSRKNGDDK